VRAIARALARPVVGLIVGLVFVCTLAFSSFESTFAQFLHERFGTGPSTVAFLFVAIGVTNALVQGVLVRRLAKRFKEPSLIAAGALGIGLGFASLLLARGTPSLLGSIVLISIGAGLLNPALSGLVSRRASAHEQGEVLGSFQAMSAMGRILGPMWGESTYFRWGARAPHLTGALLEGLACVLAATRLKAQNDRLEEGP
jgi:DHA1 family tetracycline resistance protein-like MFS transporter